MIKNNKNYSDKIHDMDYAEHLCFKGLIQWHDKNTRRLNYVLVILVLALLFSCYVAYNKYSHYELINQESVSVYALRDIDKDF